MPGPVVGVEGRSSRSRPARGLRRGGALVRGAPTHLWGAAALLPRPQAPESGFRGALLPPPGSLAGPGRPGAASSPGAWGRGIREGWSGDRGPLPPGCSTPLLALRASNASAFKILQSVLRLGPHPRVCPGGSSVLTLTRWSLVMRVPPRAQQGVPGPAGR